MNAPEKALTGVARALAALGLAPDAPVGPRPRRAVADDAYITAVSAGAMLAALPAAEQGEVFARGEAAILATAKRIRAEKAQVRRAGRRERIEGAARGNAEFPRGQWPVIYADPPWRYEAGDSSRSTENHYPTMSLAEIEALPVETLAGDDALLFLWVRGPHLLHDGLRSILAKWRFAYVSHLVWAKDSIGMGFWAREQHEILLICKRGNFPAPAPGDVSPSVVFFPRAGVSEKPERFYEIIERYTPGMARLELFARLTPYGKGVREGWDVWGNEAGGAAVGAGVGS